MLTDEELARYHDEGFIIPDYRLSNTTLAKIRSMHSQFIERYPVYSYDGFPYTKVFYALGFDFRVISVQRPSYFVSMLAEKPHRLKSFILAFFGLFFYGKPDGPRGHHLYGFVCGSLCVPVTNLSIACAV